MQVSKYHLNSVKCAAALSWFSGIEYLINIHRNVKKNVLSYHMYG